MQHGYRFCSQRKTSLQRTVIMMPGKQFIFRMRVRTVKAVFSIPEEYRNKECGTDYHVYLIAENVNGEKETDYASKPVEIVYSKDHMVTVPQTGDAGDYWKKCMLYALSFSAFG